MNYKKTTLKNGLRIITIPMKETNTVTVVAMVGVGSRYESEKQAGLSHFIEHMFFKGTEKRPDNLAISEELDSIGGEYNAFTGKDMTGYYAKVDAVHFETALDVVSDIYLNSKIDPEELEKEKGTILQEISMYEDMPRRNVSDVFDNLLYGKNSLGRDIAGYRETVAGFKRKNFLDYMKSFYLANDTVIAISGKFDERKAIDSVKKYFSKMNKGKKPEFKKVSENQKSPSLKIKHKKTDQTHLIVGQRAYHSEHRDRFILSLISVILGGNASSRLFVEVREKRGLAYYVNTGVDAYDDCGNIATHAGVEHGKLEEAVRVILSEYKKITTEKVSEKELKKAKDFVKGRMVMGLESSDEVAMFFVDQELKRKKIMLLDELFAKIDKVTSADILRVAQDVFQNSKLNLAIIGPHKNENKIKSFLKI